MISTYDLNSICGMIKLKYICISDITKPNTMSLSW